MLVYQASQSALDLGKEEERLCQRCELEAQVSSGDNARDLTIIRLNEDEARVDNHWNATKQVIVESDDFWSEYCITKTCVRIANLSLRDRLPTDSTTQISWARLDSELRIIASHHQPLSTLKRIVKPNSFNTSIRRCQTANSQRDLDCSFRCFMC